MRKLMAGLLAAFLAVGAAWAGGDKKGVLKSEEVKAAVDKLTTEVRWHPTLDSARAEGKLVLWIHLLGKLDGAS